MQLRSALERTTENEFASLRYDALLKRVGNEPIPVHVILTRTDTVNEVVVELVP